uniref:Uncharacterized protein n=1 Tax=Chenopodium quinoa TaxID=63459 RepID=A0A803LHN1_CHEQI
MVPSGPSTPIGGTQSVNPSLLRSNSGMLGGQGGSMPSQGGFPSLVSPRNQYNNVNLLGNVANVSSLLNQSYGNGGANSGIGVGNGPRGGLDVGAESDPLSGIGNGMGFNPASSYGTSNMVNPSSSGQSQGQGQGQQFPNSSGNQMLQDQAQSQQLESQNFQHQQQQFPANQQPQQQQYRGGLGGVGPVKLEPQASSDQHGPPQQQQLQPLRGLSQGIPQQRSQTHQQFPPQNMPLRSPVKPVYEPGTCARRLTHYMYQQQHRPEDNNIDFWRKFVAEYFALNAKKKWCVSMYGSGRQTTGVFPQDVWHCEICKRKPGRGFEATVEVLPRLFKIKYESGTLEELLYVDMPREYQNSSGQIVLDYAKAIQESVFEQLRVVRDGQLRIVFSPDLKVSQLGTAAQKYQAATQNSSSNMSVSDLQSNCNMFVASARQLAKTLEVPLVNDLGYTKRYVRCLQISEVVNSMKDLIDYSRSTGAGPMGKIE